MMYFAYQTISQWRRGFCRGALAALALSSVACSTPPPSEARQVAERFASAYYIDNELDSAAQVSGEPLRSLLLKRHKAIDATTDNDFAPATRPVPEIVYVGGQIVDKVTAKLEFKIRPDIQALDKLTLVLMMTKTDDVWRVTELNESMR